MLLSDNWFTCTEAPHCTLNDALVQMSPSTHTHTFSDLWMSCLLPQVWRTLPVRIPPIWMWGQPGSRARGGEGAPDEEEEREGGGGGDCRSFITVHPATGQAQLWGRGRGKGRTLGSEAQKLKGAGLEMPKERFNSVLSVIKDASAWACRYDEVRAKGCTVTGSSRSTNPPNNRKLQLP